MFPLRENLHITAGIDVEEVRTGIISVQNVSSFQAVATSPVQSLNL